MRDQHSEAAQAHSSTELSDKNPTGPDARPSLALDPPIPASSHPPEIPADRLDPDALKVIYRLRHMRHQAYLVGGCVRDLLLDRTPKDFDVATDAHPGEVRAVFRNCRLIGRRFRLAHVYFRGGKVIEVATFRKNPIDALEDVPENGDLLITRDNVFGTAEEDALRRDFSVNGLFYDVLAGEVIDYVGGRADLEAHRIATIGDPEIRIREDPVRALRAVRFAARLGFTIGPDTFAAMRRHAGELTRCAPPRLLEEIFKILRCGQSARAFDLLRACGALALVLPPLAAALERGADPERRRFAAHLAALDELVQSGVEVSEPVLLGTLMLHLRRSDKAVIGAAEDEAEALLVALVQAARLPRRIAERTRLALHAQRLLRVSPRRRRHRRGGLSGQSYFHDALHLLEITVRATGEGAAELERMRAQLLDGPGRHPRREREVHSPAGSESSAPGMTAVGVEATQPAGPESATVETTSFEPGAPRRRRRRRGGRRRRRRGSGSGAVSGLPPPPESPSEA